MPQGSFAAALPSVASLVMLASAPPENPGLYARAQAERGKALYHARCAACHGDGLRGATALALAGPAFRETKAPQPTGAA